MTQSSQRPGWAVFAGCMGRCFALTRIDLTRRPQALGRLWFIFGRPAHLHVLCSIWAFLIRPKQNHKSGGANAVGLPSSSTQPQSSEVIHRMHQPSTWPNAWELSLNLSQHPEPPIPSSFSSPFCSFPLLYSITHISECQGSDVLAPHPPPASWSCGTGWRTYGIHIMVIYYSSLNLSRSRPTDAAEAFPHSTKCIYDVIF